nr:DUF4255 domain-containing protein [Kineococcus aurantiacus]
MGIAATTAVIRSLLQNALPEAQLNGVLGPITVSALPPDRISESAETSRLNLFMYQVRPNTGWSTAELPSAAASGRRTANPPLALDLGYLLSAYGKDNFHGEILLGYGALVIHRTRVLTRAAVQQTFAGSPPADLTLLATAELESQEELVSLSMEPLTTEEMSRLWQVFGERYRPSIAFTAHVLLLRADDPVAPPGPPVLISRLGVTTSIHPTITAVEPRVATAGTTTHLELVGTSLLTPRTRALFGSGEAEDPQPGSTPLRVRVPLPGTLRAGVNTVRVQQPALFEGEERPGVESTVAPFVLRPAFTTTGAGIPSIVVSGGTPSGPRISATVTVRLRPDVGRRQDVRLLLTQTGAAAGAVPHAATVAAPSRAAAAADSTDTIAFRVDDVPRGDYLARVRVDGVETELGQVNGVYAEPVVDLR